MKILITGDLGFVGTETKKYLDGLNEVAEKAWAAADKPADEFIPPFAYQGYDLMNGEDIRDIKQFRKVVSEYGPDRVLHLAAIARFAEADKDPMRAFETNVEGTRNIAEVCDDLKIGLVYASTGSVYMPIHQAPPITEEFATCGNSVYGCAKNLGELYVKRMKAPYIILRYAHLYGREKRMHGLIGGFLDRINRGLAPTLYGGKQSNDFTYIKDVARANHLAIAAAWDKWNQVYNIGTGEELTAEQAGKIICDFSGFRGSIEVKEQRTVDPGRFVYDCKKAEAQLGFKAEYTFAKGLEDMFGHAMPAAPSPTDSPAIDPQSQQPATPPTEKGSG